MSKSLKTLMTILLSFVILFSFLFIASYSTNDTVAYASASEKYKINYRTEKEINKAEELFGNCDGLEEFILSYMTNENYLNKFPAIIPAELEYLDGNNENITKNYTYLFFVCVKHMFDFSMEHGEFATDEIRCILDHFVPLKEDVFELLDCIFDGRYMAGNKCIVSLFKKLNETIEETYSVDDCTKEFYKSLHKTYLNKFEQTDEKQDTSFDLFSVIKKYDKMLFSLFNYSESDFNSYFNGWINDEKLLDGKFNDYYGLELLNTLESIESGKGDILDQIWLDKMTDEIEELVWDGYSDSEKFDKIKDFWENNEKDLSICLPIFNSLSSEEQISQSKKYLIYTFNNIVLELQGYISSCELSYDIIKGFYNRIMPLLYYMVDFFDEYSDGDYPDTFIVNVDLNWCLDDLCAGIFTVDDTCFLKKFAITNIYKEANEHLYGGNYSESYLELINDSINKINEKTTKDEVKALLSAGIGTYEVVYSWSRVNLCTASLVCKNGEKQAVLKSESKSGIFVKDSEATETTNEKGHFEVTFADSDFGSAKTPENSYENTSDIVIIETPSNVGLIVGISIGSVALCGIIFCVIWFPLKKKRLK